MNEPLTYAKGPDQYKFALAQLRHAYAHCINGTVGDMTQFADGLLGPAIVGFENALDEIEKLRQEIALLRNELKDVG